MPKKPLEGLLLQQIGQRRLKIVKIDYFSNEFQLSLNQNKNEIFEILGLDNKMSTSFGQDEPHRRPKKAYFSCAIGIYFMPFFYEHPVCRTIIV